MSIDVAESNEVGNDDGGDCEDKTVKKLSYFKNLNKTTDYLTHNARQAFT